MEKLPQESENSEMEQLEDLYDKIYEAQMFVKEFMWKEGSYGAAVGSQQKLVEALGLDSADDIDAEVIDKLPFYIPFAMPGSGSTRPEAVQNAFDEMQKLAEDQADSSDRPHDVYGSFTLGDATITSYLPDKWPGEWTIAIDIHGAEPIIHTLPMDHQPVFGPDVSDVGMLNDYVEKLIVKYKLEEGN